MKLATIIVAGGSGSRMGTETPKQFLLLGGLPVLMRTIMSMRDAVNNYVNNFIIVLPSIHIEYWKELCEQYKFDVEHQITQGGATRFESVRNGLSLVQDADLVSIHDGVRPFATEEMVERIANSALQSGAAIPVIDLTDSLREIVNNSLITSSRIVDRSRFKAVQTPQIFRKEVITEAYRQNYDPRFTDDASVVEYTGRAISLVEGSAENIKITTPTDLKLANILINES